MPRNGDSEGKVEDQPQGRLDPTRTPRDRAFKLSDPVHERLGHYVYRLVDPRSGSTFYVGKGQGGRTFQHVMDARYLDIESRKLGRIREIEAAGHAVSFLIHRHDLTSKVAYEVEAALIDAYPDALNVADGHHNEGRGCMPLSELIALYEAPKVRITVPGVLINIGQEWYRGLAAEPDKLYERTCQYWACAPEKHQAEYAFAVSRGVIREVYRIDGPWQRHNMKDVQYAMDRTETPKHEAKSKWRWSFKGFPAPDMRDYVGLRVDPPRKPGDANPIKWINC